MSESKSELSQADVKQARNFTGTRRPPRGADDVFPIFFRRSPLKGGIAQRTVRGAEDVPPRLASTSLVGS